MANRQNIHVVQRGVSWGTLREGGQRASQVYGTQAQAIQAGRQMARQGQGELLIHGRDGQIRACDTYGNDPCPPKDGKSNDQGRYQDALQTRPDASRYG